MKKKVLLSSILTILLCLSLIAGSTFALFTSTSTINIAVTAGKVDVFADLVNLKCYSVVAEDGGAEVDEFGNEYNYQLQPSTDPNKGQFLNTGTVAFANGVLTLDRITPGDKVEFDITGANTSDVTIQYRYIIECIEGYKLMSGLVLTLNDVEYNSIASYTSPWYTLPAGQNMEDLTPLNVVVELPVAAGNEYQEKGASINITVEAVQANADVEVTTAATIVPIPTVDNATDLKNALTDPDVPAINLAGDIDAFTIDYDISDKVIYANGDVAFTFDNCELTNVVIDGIVAESGKRSINFAGAKGDITVVNSKFISGNGTGASAMNHGADIDITIDNCEFATAPAAGKAYAIYTPGATGALTITNSKFEGMTSWAIMLNNTVYGDVLIDNCTFNTNDGAFKTLLSGGVGVTGDFTFTNNTMNLPGHDGKITSILVSGGSNGPVTCGGVKTVTGNTLNGVAWAQ